MGAKFWFVAISDGDARAHLKSLPTPDIAASRDLAQRLYPNCEMDERQEATLDEADPRKGRVLVGVYPGVTVIAAEELALDAPSKIPTHVLALGAGKRLTLHAQHSVVDWSAFAIWENGELVRSLSVSGNDGLIEDVGDRLPFEHSFWQPDEPYDEDDPDSFGHPLEMGEDALLHLLGFQYEVYADAVLFDPEQISIPAFVQSPAKPFWKFW